MQNQFNNQGQQFPQQGQQQFPQQGQQQFPQQNQGNQGASTDKELYGNVKTIQTQYGTMFKIGLNLTELQKLTAIAQQEGEWVNLVVKQGRSGNWYIERDTWKPNQGQQGGQQFPQQGGGQPTFPNPNQGGLPTFPQQPQQFPQQGGQQQFPQQGGQQQFPQQGNDNPMGT